MKKMKYFDLALSILQIILDVAVILLLIRQHMQEDEED
jgi:hypothetical protein